MGRTGTRKFVVRHNDCDFEVEYDIGDGLEIFKFQLFSITSVPPDHQKIVGVDDNRVVSDDYDLTSICETLRLITTDHHDEAGDEEPEQSSGNDAQLVADMSKSDEELARMLQAEEEALLLQQAVVVEDNRLMEQKIRPYIDQVLMYEDPVRQKAARETVPIDALEEQAVVSLAKEAKFEPLKNEKDHSFLLQLLFWFKQSFSWVHAPPCEVCGNDTTSQGMGTPLPSETRYGGSRVEIYCCKNCSRITRFPRYNDPMKLLETRRGRCGEWANCFALYCRAFGYETRLILDFTDHVWVECLSDNLGRWMHLDPCEGIYDRPLLYEKGWGKNLNYVIAIAKDGVYDVTKRYTRKWPEVLRRRNICTESSLAEILAGLTKECRRSISSQQTLVLERRERKEIEIIERDLYSKEDVSSLPGRQSGDKEWRILRSEYGPQGCNTSSSISCPVRVCVDVHVTRIYDALSRMLFQMVKTSSSASKMIEVLKWFKETLRELRKLPFRSRRLAVKFSSGDLLICQVLPSVDDLFKAVNLSYELGHEDIVNVGLAGEPVKTALSLPVALDALDDMIDRLSQIDIVNADLPSLPLLKLNRIHSGSVLASGEEPPFGVATSAFDGIRASKWEEPNGAQGCWIVYKLPDKKMEELMGYDLMSANDASERDPKDWILEGSEGGGSDWHILDRQTGQNFENRFERKTYKIKPSGIPFKVFRFRFTSVRDGDSTSRLQVGAIDLYGRKGDSAQPALQF